MGKRIAGEHTEAHGNTGSTRSVTKAPSSFRADVVKMWRLTANYCAQRHGGPIHFGIENAPNRHRQLPGSRNPHDVYVCFIIPCVGQRRHRAFQQAARYALVEPTHYYDHPPRSGAVGTGDLCHISGRGGGRVYPA